MAIICIAQMEIHLTWNGAKIEFLTCIRMCSVTIGILFEIGIFIW